MKPNWENAPDWARYLAMDKDGRWHWYEHKPVARFTIWWEHRAGRKQAVPMFYQDWRDTLEEKPNKSIDTTA